MRWCSNYYGHISRLCPSPLVEQSVGQEHTEEIELAARYPIVRTRDNFEMSLLVAQVPPTDLNHLASSGGGCH